MIFRRPPPDAPVDQGDVIDGCPLVTVSDFDERALQTIRVDEAVGRVVVLTQTCDLANQKVSQVVVAVVLDANEVVTSGQLKGAEVRGLVRAGRVFGWYFLPRSEELGLGEMIVDFRQPVAYGPARPAPRLVCRRMSPSPHRTSVPGTSQQALRRLLQPHRTPRTLRDRVISSENTGARSFSPVAPADWCVSTTGSTIND